MSIRYTSPRPYRRMTPEYTAYLNAQARCSCGPEDKNYPDYAGRGIKFLFTNFEQFLAEIGPKPSPEMMLDRMDNDGHYEPGNIHWTTPSKSSANKRLTQSRIDHLERVSILGAKTATHVRWHVNRGIVKGDCTLCQPLQ